MIGTWLYDRILEVEEDRQPSFANLSISNWFNALRFEIYSAHGLPLHEQLTSCRDFIPTIWGKLEIFFVKTPKNLISLCLHFLNLALYLVFSNPDCISSMKRCKLEPIANK